MRLLACDPITRPEKVIKTNEISTLLPKVCKTNGISTLPRLAGWLGWLHWLAGCLTVLAGCLAGWLGWLIR